MKTPESLHIITINGIIFDAVKLWIVVIKQVAYDRLHSLNEEYDDIYPYEEGAKLIGRVLCKISPDMIPTPEQVNLYNEAVDTFDVKG